MEGKGLFVQDPVQGIETTPLSHQDTFPLLLFPFMDFSALSTVTLPTQAMDTGNQISSFLKPPKTEFGQTIVTYLQNNSSPRDKVILKDTRLLIQAQKLFEPQRQLSFCDSLMQQHHCFPVGVLLELCQHTQSTCFSPHTHTLHLGHH